MSREIFLENLYSLIEDIVSMQHFIETSFHTI